MDREFLKKYFSESQIEQISDAEYKVIRNFFNSQELAHIDRDQVLRAVHMLAPVFRDVRVVDMFEYMNKVKNPGSDIPLKSPPPPEPDPFPVSLERGATAKKEDIFLRDSQDRENLPKNEGSHYIEGKYLVQQVWILEYLINNPNLLTQGGNIENVKRLLQEKELELKLHNLFLQKFFEAVNHTGDPQIILRFKHFETFKKDLAIRIHQIQKAAPVNFKGMIELFQEFGFEDRDDLNIGLCSVLAELVKEPKLQKLLKYTEQNFKEVDLQSEKKRYLRKIFRE